MFQVKILRQLITIKLFSPVATFRWQLPCTQKVTNAAIVFRTLQDMVVLHDGTKRLHVACRECALIARKLCAEFKCPECRQPLSKFLFVRTCVQCFQEKRHFHNGRRMSLRPEYNFCWDWSQRKKRCVICKHQ